MAQKSWFFDSKDGDREYGTVDLNEIYRIFFSTGIIVRGGNQITDDLEVSVVESTMKTQVNFGYAIIEGRVYRLDSEMEELVHDLPDALLPRIDRVVLELNTSEDYRSIRLVVVKGETAEEPSPEPLVRTGSIYQISLAQVLVSANTSTLAVDAITDERSNLDVCGISNLLLGINAPTGNDDIAIVVDNSGFGYLTKTDQRSLNQEVDKSLNDLNRPPDIDSSGGNVLTATFKDVKVFEGKLFTMWNPGEISESNDLTMDATDGVNSTGDLAIVDIDNVALKKLQKGIVHLIYRHNDGSPFFEQAPSAGGVEPLLPLGEFTIAEATGLEKGQPSKLDSNNELVAAIKSYLSSFDLIAQGPSARGAIYSIIPAGQGKFIVLYNSTSSNWNITAVGVRYDIATETFDMGDTPLLIFDAGSTSLSGRFYPWAPTSTSVSFVFSWYDPINAYALATVLTINTSTLNVFKGSTYTFLTTGSPVPYELAMVEDDSYVAIFGDNADLVRKFTRSGNVLSALSSVGNLDSAVSGSYISNRSANNKGYLVSGSNKINRFTTVDAVPSEGAPSITGSICGITVISDDILLISTFSGTTLYLYIIDYDGGNWTIIDSDTATISSASGYGYKGIGFDGTNAYVQSNDLVSVFEIGSGFRSVNFKENLTVSNETLAFLDSTHDTDEFPSVGHLIWNSSLPPYYRFRSFYSDNYSDANALPVKTGVLGEKVPAFYFGVTPQS